MHCNDAVVVADVNVVVAMDHFLAPLMINR